MRTRSTPLLIAAFSLASIALFERISTADKPSSPPPTSSAGLLPSLAEARARAALLHETLHATLHVVHHSYYREDEGLPIPAAELSKVFRHLQEEQKIKLRWLAVEGEAMNLDHKPRDEFEHAAVASIRDRRAPHESSDGGILRRAAAITLTAECLKCHVPNRKSTEDRSAGLIISIPYRAGE